MGDQHLQERRMRASDVDCQRWESNNGCTLWVASRRCRVKKERHRCVGETRREKDGVRSEVGQAEESNEETELGTDSVN